MIVLVFANLPNCYGIETKIRDDREYREIVVHLGIESVSCDIEIVGEYLDEKYGDECGRDLSSDLC